MKHFYTLWGIGLCFIAWKIEYFNLIFCVCVCYAIVKIV